jgi:hypothetical protein
MRRLQRFLLSEAGRAAARGDTRWAEAIRLWARALDRAFVLITLLLLSCGAPAPVDMDAPPIAVTVELSDCSRNPDGGTNWQCDGGSMSDPTLGGDAAKAAFYDVFFQ